MSAWRFASHSQAAAIRHRWIVEAIPERSTPMSEKKKDYEKELLSSETIGRDAIVLISNSENGVNDLSIKEIKKIYDGTVKDWSEL